MSFSERLKTARDFAGMSQDELAEKSGVKQGSISKIERGDAKSSTFTVQLAIACGVRPEWLALGDGEMVDTPPDQREKALLEMFRKCDERGKDATYHIAARESEYSIQGIDNDTKNAT